MQPIVRDYAYPSRRPPSPLTANAQPTARLRIDAGKAGQPAELTWRLPYAVTVSHLAEVSFTLSTAVGEVPILLRVLDGPRLELRFGSQLMPCNFADFRITVRSDAFAETEMGGASYADGYLFTSPPSLADELLHSQTLQLRVPVRGQTPPRQSPCR